ncbi:Coupling of ubiquitin conjugation to ER degradation protein 1 [Wickerhamiella sorbophila]|uniref:Coupling of ubiquitin conjugation to ER degradation protein 1 n=1 Tax=Wickerhamiella sorbophila TaxID=45607 RepID=A0A2T0FJB1_9ASCO|nr:Coupling of ubiquitin conjugation to ER degradation protein 1 [Wickerhamiella sorbophila]PRT55092.1 Coupling of ubiquitin conjugation to ER degradation protein 1 [Wickerhamiella sorbophila]
MSDTSTWLLLAGVAMIFVTAKLVMHVKPPAQRDPGVERRRGRVRNEMVEIVEVMLPQVPRDVILHDLAQTRNVERTIDRLLVRVNRNEFAERPPFQAKPAASKAKAETLLDRYNVSLDEQEQAFASGWKDSRQERETQLRAQRQSMILKARQAALKKSE